MFAFAGPAYLVSVGYMDPGNWATDLEGGARFGYQLLWVLVLSNFMAILLQTLSARLGIVSGRDLAQACRETYPKPVARALWMLCEIAIAACDLAEVLGAAIGLNLLFGLPLIAGVLVTALDTILLLWVNRYGIRVLESVILGFVTIIGGCFLVEILLARPDMAEVAKGLLPKLTDESLYVAIGILGATVMPHNLYLHSSLVQTRSIGATEAAKRSACKFNLVDSVIALNGALLVNAAILIMAGATFFKSGIVVTEIQQAHHLLAPLLGTTLASAAFAIALLCSGQSSTITGTMAGQIVMEGFLNFRMRPWLRRLITRLAAVAPAVFTILYAGEKATYQLLILSQVVLSLQLPFAVIPLIHFTSDRKRMGVFANRPWVKVLAWGSALLIVALNLRLVVTALGQWLPKTGAAQGWIAAPLFALLAGLAGLLGWVALEPLLRRKAPPAVTAGMPPPELAAPVWRTPQYARILVTLDHSELDRIALGHAGSLARAHGATLFLLHIEEGVTSQVYGNEAATAEVEEGRKYFEDLVEAVRSNGIAAELLIVHGKSPKETIIQESKRLNPDLLVMGAHGHKGLKDIIFGATINEVRHAVGVPVLIVRDDRSQ
jgi:manganese transport protein